MRRIGWFLMALSFGACATDGETDGDAGSAVMGCAEVGGQMCPSGQMCCSGVPYPSEGTCQTTCEARSDRHAKEGFEAVDADAVLQRLAELEVTEWSYRGDGARHVGPMAQDFHAAFDVGRDDRVIAQVDADGVLIASVQALHRRLLALQRENAALRDQNRELATRVRALEAR